VRDGLAMIPEAHLQSALSLLGRSGEVIRCPIAGDCMAPLLQEGDVLLIQCGNDDIGAGDVVVYGSPGDWWVHRVAGVSSQGGDHFVLQGDQHSYAHVPVPRESILGRVIEVRGANGRMRLTSGLWRGVNRLLWLRSYVSVRRYRPDSPLWKAVAIVYLLRARFLPRGWSISLLPFRVLCGLNRVWVRARGRYVGGKGEG
jgi:hypothetical protein